MLDFSVWEFVVIGGVALIVIGPERLPRVARTAGHLLGRFQRYVSEVKSDISREIELAELKQLQSSVEDAARSIQHSVKTGVEEAENQLKEAETELKAAGAELRKTEEDLRQTASGFLPPHMGTSIGAASADDALATQPAASLPDPSFAPPSTDVGLPSGEPGSQTSTEDSEDPSPQLELGLNPKAGEPVASKPA